MTPTNVEKRKERDEAEEGDYQQLELKRQKISEIDHQGAAILGSIKDVSPKVTNEHEMRTSMSAESNAIGANELASAFALASLASAMSPNNATRATSNRLPSNNGEVGYESRDADNDTASIEQGTIGGGEYHSIPISPEERSPIRNTKQHVSPHHQHRRVTFADDTKNTSRQKSRRLSLPPRSNTSSSATIAARSSSVMAKPSMVSRSSSMPPGFAAARRDQYVMQQQHHHHPYSPSRQHHLHQQHQQRSPLSHHQLWATTRHQQLHNVHQNNSRQSNLFLPSLQHPPPHNSQQRRLPVPPSHIVTSPKDDMHHDKKNSNSSSSNTWICDFCNVASFDTYEEACIHEGGCRARCLTGVTARPEQQAWSPYLGPMYFGPRSGSSGGASPQQQHQYLTHSPASVVVGHGHVPPPAPPPLPIHMRYNTRMETSPSKTDYKTISPNISPKVGAAEKYACSSTISTQGSVEMTESSLEGGGSYSLSPRDNNDEHQQNDSGTETSQQTTINDGQLKEGESIVLSDDMEMVPPYVFYLMSQVESTHFTEADRFVARSKGPVGFSGFQCCHCHGHAGLGKYFPVTAKSLSTNSTSQNIHSHLLKCRKVAPYVKEQLITLKEEKSKAPRLEPGWRRIFFEKIWSRLHGNNS